MSNSLSAEIRGYAMQLLSNGKQWRYGELVNNIREMSPHPYTEGMFAGALRDLVSKNKEYRIMGRGYYIFDPVSDLETNTNDSLKDSVSKLLETTISGLVETVGTRNALNENLQIIQIVKEVISYLEETQLSLK